MGLVMDFTSTTSQDPAMSDTTTSTNTLVHLPETFTFHFHPIPDWMKEKGQLYPAIIRKLLSCLTNV